MLMQFRYYVKCQTIVLMQFSYTSLIHGRKNVTLNAALFRMTVCRWWSKSWSLAELSMLQRTGNRMRNGCLKSWKNVHDWKIWRVKATATLVRNGVHKPSLNVAALKPVTRLMILSSRKFLNLRLKKALTIQRFFMGEILQSTYI